MKFAIRSTSLVLLLAVSMLVVSTPAHAAFPGKNGRISFVGGFDLFTMNPDGSDVRQITNLGPDNAAGNHSWSADGKQIVANECSVANCRGEIWLMNADGSNHHLVLKSSNLDNWTPSFTPDGKWIVFTRCKLTVESCALFKMLTDGTSISAVTQFVLGVQDFWPSYSPDGQTLAFTSFGRRGIVSAIYRLGPTDKGPVPITPAALDAQFSDWSPDASAIAYASHGSSPQNQDIRLVNPRGGDRRRLTKNGNDYFNGPHDFFPAWSPQGDAIVFERDSPDFSTFSIYILKPDGSQPTRLLTVPVSAQARIARQRMDQALRNPKVKIRNSSPSIPIKQIQANGADSRWGVAAE
jgi:Tol biopolymer transport system component